MYGMNAFVHGKILPLEKLVVNEKFHAADIFLHANENKKRCGICERFPHKRSAEDLSEQISHRVLTGEKSRCMLTP